MYKMTVHESEMVNDDEMDVAEEFCNQKSINKVGQNYHKISLHPSTL